MAPYDGEPSHRQQVVLAFMPKIAAALSIIDSGFIVYDCLFRNRRHRREQSTYHRLRIGLSSVCDLFMSAGLSTSTWPMPLDTKNVVWAAGNVATCEAVGFIEQAGVAATMYNGSRVRIIY
jgi:hypothetical protein